MASILSQYQCDNLNDGIYQIISLLEYIGLSHMTYMHSYQQVRNFLTEYLTHLPPEQNARHFADDIFRRIFLNEKFCVLIKISLKFVPKGPIYNNPALV